MLALMTNINYFWCMKKPLSRQGSHATVVSLDFSGRQAIKEREQRAAEADRQLHYDPEFQEVADRVAASDEQRAIEHDKKAGKLLIAAVAAGAATVGADLLVGQLFHMQQFLLGEDVKELSQRITHGALLALGGIPTAALLVVGLGEASDAERARRTANWTRGNS
jgi:hypothetical protein